MDSVFLHGCAILAADGAITRELGVLVEAGGSIGAVLPASADPPARRQALPPECLLAPGLIDIQVNGGGGVQFNDDPCVEAARHIARAHRRLGTTAILPTLITSDRDTMARAAAAAFGAPGSGVLGIHFEGPFLSPARPGVHDRAMFRPPDEKDLACLTALAAARAGVVLVTVAPECAPADTWHLLARAGVILSAGHSAAAYEEVGPSVTGVTHLFNAMEPPSARSPGLVAAALLSDRYTGVIVDGHHVHPAMLRLLLAVKPAGRIVLVSDAMAPAGTDATSFVLQGRTILRQGGRLTTEDGTLAGADLCLAQALRNATSMLGVPRAEAIGMASANPADFLGIGARHGRIAPGRQADLVLFDPSGGVLGTWLAGAWEASP
jgi:N-acetylglucosamine-6-phosphate deacetylase